MLKYVKKHNRLDGCRGPPAACNPYMKIFHSIAYYKYKKKQWWLENIGQKAGFPKGRIVSGRIGAKENNVEWEVFFLRAF